jgi:WSC domain
VGTCAGKGYRYAGAEYGSQCWCGNDVLKSGDGKGGVMVSEGECVMKCAGDTSEWCGAGNRLSVWGSV